MKTVLITGASAGLGRAVARRFAAEGWNVAATMRRPGEERELDQLPNVACLALDVTDEGSIKAALEGAIARFGQLDVVVNNAGYGLSGVFESLSDAQIRRQFETNVFGLMNVTLPSGSPSKSSFTVETPESALHVRFAPSSAARAW